MTVYSNPQYYDGPVTRLVKLAAKDSQTWQAGQFVRTTDSGIVLCKSNASSITGLTAQTQSTATSSSNVWVNVIPGASTRFVIGVTTGGADTKAGEVLIGSNEGLAVNSCVCTLSTGNDSTEILRVDDVLGRVEPNSGNNDTNDVPGFAIIHVVASALDAEGAGL
jgi:hypothetical protein